MNNTDLSKVIRILRKETKSFTTPSVTLIAQSEKDPFNVLISTILSARTKDEVTLAASMRLFKLASNVSKMNKLNLKQIEKAIYPVGFYITKAKRVKETCKILISDYKGKVPEDLDELLKLPGVGRKTANLVLTEGFQKHGICVDTHVHKISNRLGYVKTKNPKETEFALRDKLPKKYWIEYNYLLVMWGQQICRPISPFCSKCKISKYCKKVGIGKSR